MDLYVMTAGEAQEHDYAWRRIEAEAQPHAVPPLFTERFARVAAESGFSLVLGRAARGRVLLVVTGLPSERKDFRARTLRVALALEGEAEDEAVLRMVAAGLLRGDLGERLVRTVSEHAAAGFQVGREALLHEIEEVGRGRDAAPDRTRQVASDTPDNRRALAEELEQHRLPDGEGPLVVVTRAILSGTLDEVGVWRGLSNLVPHEDWRELSREGGAAKKWSGMAALAVVLAAAILLWMLAR